jgi:hypothetical protein
MSPAPTAKRETGGKGAIMRARKSEISRSIVLTILGFLAVVAGIAATGTATAQGEWRVYRNPAHGLRILYPPQFTAKRLDLRPAEGTVAVQEWTREGGPDTIRLTVIDKPAGMSLREWITRERPGRFAPIRIAGRPAFVVEAVFDGQLTTDVYVTSPKSGAVINFTHTVRGITDWAGKPVIRVKNRYRNELRDFWNMVESTKFLTPEDE